MLRVVEMAVADVRSRGIDLEIHPVDDKEDEAVAREVATKLAADPRVIAVVGHKNSGPSKAAAPVYAEAGLAQVTQCATDNSLSRSGWRTFFRLCADNERQAAVAAEHIHASLPNARVLAVHDGTDYGRPLVEAFARRVLVAAVRAGVERERLHLVALAGPQVEARDGAELVLGVDGVGLVRGDLH